MLAAGWFFSSCTTSRYSRQRVMFQLTDEQGNRLDTAKLRAAVNRTAKNYRIQPNDYLDVRVYTNKGERILDPNGELQFGAPAGAVRSLGRPGTTGGAGGAAGGGGRSNVGQGAGSSTGGSEFLVQADGTVTLPMVNRVRVRDLSLLQADSLLKISYETYYKDVFVTTRVTNNRVIILGAPGGQVVSLTNDNMNLLEVLALAGGLEGNNQGGGGGQFRFGGKANNIRIIRGDLKNPQVEQVDLTTLAGMRRANLQMEPNDVVYIEPIRRPFLEFLTDATPAIGALSILFNITVLVYTVLRR